MLAAAQARAIGSSHNDGMPLLCVHAGHAGTAAASCRALRPARWLAHRLGHLLANGYANRRAAVLLALLFGLLCAVAPAASAGTWRVGPSGEPMSFAQAAREALDGDTIELLPGEYRGEVAVLLQRRLTIRGVGQRPIFIANGKVAEGKAIWVIRNGDITIENVEFRGARAPHRNGAGIRFEQGRLTVKRCSFFDNQNGILTANNADSELQIEDSEFGNAPRVADALHHLIYVGMIKRFSIRGSRFENGYYAHLIKSRARSSHIAYNLIADGPLGQAAYEIDLPNGGQAHLVGNVIQQSARTTNPVVVSFGTEGRAWPGSSLLMVHNTLVSAARPGAWFLRVWDDKLPPNTPVHVLNNLSVGTGVLSLGAHGHFEGNYPALAAMLVDADKLDFALPQHSLLRGLGVSPKLDDGTDLSPQAEFTLPVGTRPLAPPAAWTPGAFQR